MTASQAAKEAGLESLAQMSRIVKRSPQTLDNWYKHYPELFEVVLLGCKCHIENIRPSVADVHREACNILGLSKEGSKPHLYVFGDASVEHMTWDKDGELLYLHTLVKK